MNSRHKHRRALRRHRAGPATRMWNDIRTGAVISVGVWRVYRGRLPWRGAARR